MGKASKTPVQVKVWIRGQPPRRQQTLLSKLLTGGMIGGAIAAAGGGIWLALQLIVDPGSVGWVQQIIPGWDLQSLSAKAWQTREEIEADAAAAGLCVGKPIYFSTYPELDRNSAAFHQLLLPFYKIEPNCQAIDPVSSMSSSLVELRVYRPQTSTLRLPGKSVALELVDRLPMTGPEELAAIAPLVNAGIANPGSSRALLLNAVTFVNGNAPLPGIWLHVSGQWRRGSSQTLYGQVVRYDPTRGQLRSLLSWTSPTLQFPTWQQVTGGDATELVVDHTIGLEPQFQVYQFAALSTPGKPIQVKAIDLREAVADNRTYANGLLLARHGLWSTALKILQQSKKADANWSATAQAQLDLVALHARITQAQADRDWANPGQQINALLIDGQWSEALKLLRTARTNGYTPVTLLADQSDRLWNRVAAAVRVNPQPDLLNWGVLLMAVRQDRSAALAWLNQQANKPRQAEQILALLDPLPATTVAATPQLTPTAPAAAATVSVSTASSTVVRPSRRIIGSARLQRAIEPTQWLLPDPAALTLNPNQSWYEIQVLGFQEGLQWQQPAIPDLLPDADSTEIAHILWHRLGLNQETHLQLMTWTAASTQSNIQQVTAKAVRIVDGTIWLLAAGEANAEWTSESPVLAITLETLSWVEPLSTSTLAALSQQPQWIETLAPALWQELQPVPQLLPASVTDATMLLQEFGNWSVQLMELTGDDQPEAVLTLQTELASNKSATQTLIFSSSSGLLYSDLSQTGRSLQAVANLGDGSPPALIIHTAQGYAIERWSAQNQSFQ